MVNVRVVTASALVALLAACGGGGGGDAAAEASAPTSSASVAPVATTAPAPTEPPTTTPPLTGSTTSVAPQPEVVEVVMGPSKVTFTYPAGLSPDLRPAFDQYLAFLVAGISNGLDPNPGDPAIDATSTGDVNSSWKSRVAEASVSGRRFSGPFISNATVLADRGNQLELRDCAWDQATMVNAAGEVLSPPAKSFQGAYVRLELSDQWRVAAFYSTKEPCTP